MNNHPQITEILENDSILSFTLQGVDKCFANALRRTILCDIPTVVIRSEDHEVNQIHITKNTSRLHNEIIQQRISCIPIHTYDPDFADKYSLEVHVQNNEEQSIRMVTTKDFRLRIKDTNHSKDTSKKYLSEEETKKIFPPNEITQHYIDIVRLRPKMGTATPGEEIQLTAEFSVGTAKLNSMFNAVSLVTYGFTQDKIKAMETWEQLEKKYESEEMSKEEIAHAKSDFFHLDAQRHFLANSFDFRVKSVGVYENKDIVHKACSILCSRFDRTISALDENLIPILESHSSAKNGYDSIIESTVENSYDVILHNEDDTLGNILSYLMYQSYFLPKESQELTFVAFKKFHPHDAYSVLRVAYKKSVEKSAIITDLKAVLKEARTVIEEIRKMMK
jgi:DNA-directed RNA polymerase subunit L